MIQDRSSSLYQTSYAVQNCDIGVVHVGYGAFHRAHQAVYLDDYMEKTGDLSWGIAAVNLRKSESDQFAIAARNGGGTLLKTTSPENEVRYRRVRAHRTYADWCIDPDEAESLVSMASVHMITVTVTESGYYLDAAGQLDTSHPVIKSEFDTQNYESVYGYLARALECRAATGGAPLTVLCCDNIRSNGEVLKRNFLSWLSGSGQGDLANWIEDNVTFPCSMVDRITPRTTDALRTEVRELFDAGDQIAVQAEAYIQWVIQDNFAGPSPDLRQVGVELVTEVDPFEETKIRILNGGHTGLAYLGALAGYRTFDQAMDDAALRQHFDKWLDCEVLPGLTIDLPFDKYAYRHMVAQRFENAAIADTLERICMDGYSKFAIFVRPTLQSCLEQRLQPESGYRTIASWYLLARRCLHGDQTLVYEDAAWEQLTPLLADGAVQSFASHKPLWGDLPVNFPEFSHNIVDAIEKMEARWQASA